MASAFCLTVFCLLILMGFHSCSCAFVQIVAISVGVVSIAVGIGLPVFYESQIDSAVRFSLV